MTGARLRGWLLASLALNVFLVGGALGGAALWWRDADGTTRVPRLQPRGVRQAAEDLPAPLRERLGKDLREVQRGNRELARASQAGRREVLDLLQADTLNTAALDAVLQRTRESDLQARARLEAAIVGFAGALSPEQRRTFVDGLSRQGLFRPRAPDDARRRTQATGDE